MKKFYTPILVTLILIASYIVFAQRQGIEYYRNNMEAVADTLSTYKDKDGNNVTMIQSLVSGRAKDIRELATSDSTILALKKVIRENEKKLKDKGSVTVFETKTDIDTVFQTEVRFEKDSLNPIYYTKVNLDGWILGEVTAKVDSILLNLKIRNSYAIVVGEEKQGLFKKKKPFASVTNYNPYSETSDLRTYQVDLPRKRRFHIGPSALVTLKGDIVIGGGITYSFISF